MLPLLSLGASLEFSTHTTAHRVTSRLAVPQETDQNRPAAQQMNLLQEPARRAALQPVAFRSELVPLAPHLVPLPPDENVTELVVFGESDQDAIMDDTEAPNARYRKQKRRLSAEPVFLLMGGDPEVWNKGSTPDN
jgi:hypothetical protein